MNSLATWVLSILGIVLVGTLVDLLLTKSRLKSVIRSVFATITVLVVVTPLPKLVSTGSFDLDADITDGEFLTYASDLKIGVLERAVERALAAQGIEATVEIEGTADTDIAIERVTINLSADGIQDENEHINKYDSVRRLAADYLNVEEDRITVV